jgi:hypothetical protein
MIAAPRVMQYVYEWDDSHVRRLIKLVSEERARRLQPKQHPLGAGIQAYFKRATHVELAADERDALASLKLAACTLFQVEKSWAPHRERLVSDLLSARESDSVLFELATIRNTLKGSAGRIDWTRYLESEPDIRLRRPAVAVECKLLRSETRSRLHAIKDAARQHRDLREPLVIAVGVISFATRQDVEDIAREIPSWNRWFGQHRAVAAGVIFAPIDPNEFDYPMGVRGFACDFGQITIVRSKRARPALPEEFQFQGEDRSTEVGYQERSQS